MLYLPVYFHILNVNSKICRLGHREQKDEWSPRRVDAFQNRNVLPPDAVISAGSVNSSCTAGRLCIKFPGSPVLIWKFFMACFGILLVEVSVINWSWWFQIVDDLIVCSCLIFALLNSKCGYVIRVWIWNHELPLSLLCYICVRISVCHKHELKVKFKSNCGSYPS